jgi:flagellar basal body P-ring formation protein FlgA
MWRMLACVGLGSISASAGEIAIPVPVATIYPGEQVSAGALADKPFYVPDAASKSYVLQRRQIEGLVAKRMLLQERPVPLSAIKARDAVVQGVLTKAVYAADGLSISTYLVPQASASAGDIIDARNPAFGSLVKVRVLKDGTLQVGP